MSCEALAGCLPRMGSCLEPTVDGLIRLALDTHIIPDNPVQHCLEIPPFHPKTSPDADFSVRTRCVAAISAGCSMLLFTSGRKLLKFPGKGVILILFNEIKGLVSQMLIKL